MKAPASVLENAIDSANTLVRHLENDVEELRSLEQRAQQKSSQVKDQQAQVIELTEFLKDAGGEQEDIDDLVSGLSRVTERLNGNKDKEATAIAG